MKKKLVESLICFVMSFVFSSFALAASAGCDDEFAEWVSVDVADASVADASVADAFTVAGFNLVFVFSKESKSLAIKIMDKEKKRLFLRESIQFDDVTYVHPEENNGSSSNGCDQIVSFIKLTQMELSLSLEATLALIHQIATYRLPQELDQMSGISLPIISSISSWCYSLFVPTKKELKLIDLDCSTCSLKLVEILKILRGYREFYNSKMTSVETSQASSCKTVLAQLLN